MSCLEMYLSFTHLQIGYSFHMVSPHLGTSNHEHTERQGRRAPPHANCLYDGRDGHSQSRTQEEHNAGKLCDKNHQINFDITQGWSNSKHVHTWVRDLQASHLASSLSSNHSSLLSPIMFGVPERQMVGSIYPFYPWCRFNDHGVSVYIYIHVYT